MPFIDIARATYTYSPQSSDELFIEEEDLLYVLEKGEDDWWKVKKKVAGDDDGPIGLVPRNYLEDVPPISTTRTLYDYTAQTEEELSFSADLSVEIYDKEDPDWYLVRLKSDLSKGSEYGFVPSNYLDDGEVESAAKLPSVLPAGRPDSLDERRPLTPPPQQQEEPEPISPSNAMTAYGRPEQHYSVRDPSTDSKFKTWQVEEIDNRKRRKRGTLGIGNQSIVWFCEADKTPVQTWPITSLIEYNTEKKHLFIELSSPPVPASFHFHTESRAIASEISDAIGELAGAARASGLREVAAASGDPLPSLPESSALAQRHKREDSDELPIDDGVKRGLMLYDFEAQGEDELGVRQDQIVEILDDSHEEWWKCKAGSREGVVPAIYVEVIKTRQPTKKERETISAVTAVTNVTRQPRSNSVSSSSSNQPPRPQQSNQALSKPDMGKIRTWTDITGTFKVEAQFLGRLDDKVQLHKLNGVKISVPLTKMSLEDIDYVNKSTGRSSPPPPKPPPDSEKPRARKIDFDWFSFFLESGVDYNVCQRYSVAFEKDQMDESILPEINAETLRTLGVREGDILRIMKRLDEKFGRASQRKKSVRFGGESVVDEDEKEDLSDVIKISQPAERKEPLFSSGPGAALRNNTSRRGRPTPGSKAPEEVDGTLLPSPAADREEPSERHGVRPLKVPPSRLANYNEDIRKPTTTGFEDDAWTVKQQPAQQQQQIQPMPVVQSPTVQTSPPGSSIHDLASISPPQNTTQSLPPPLQPNVPASIQLSPQPAAPPVLTRPSSVPPTQTAPQLQPLQPHFTGIPSQIQGLTGPSPAQASGNLSLDQQLAKLQLYRQQQMLQTQTTGFVPQFQQPQATGFANGFSSPPQTLQPQSAGFMTNFLTPSQPNSQVGPARSFSVGLATPLIPTNSLSAPQPQPLLAVKTGPANFGPTQPQYPAPLPTQPTGFQNTFQQSNPTGFQAQQPVLSLQPQPNLAPEPAGFTQHQQPSFLQPTQLHPQQTGFPQQMLPKAYPTAFKPVSFGTSPKPLVPTRTGKRANLAAASIAP